MPLVVGLGNIGEEYQGTRHNIGFTIVERITGILSASMEKADDPFIIGVGRFKGTRTILIQPTTFMNNSGKAVLKACRMFHYLPSDILVCHDDVNLPVGKIRLRKEGRSGGHNGIQSIIDHLGTHRFPRLRFGIGNNYQRGGQSDYVLSPFDGEELPVVNDGLKTAEAAVFCYIREGIVIAMNQFN